VLEIAHPLWLLGLALVPAVRWLHRLHAPGQPQRVPALFLWRKAATAVAPGKRRGRPDPAWRHRALLVAAAALALAQPVWTTPGTPTAEVWLDDGPALFARGPDGADRITETARALAAAAAATGTARLNLRALRRPGQSVELAAPDPLVVEGRLRAWLDGPGAGPLASPAGQGASVRWLVSTGADPRSLDALAGVRFARVIAVGQAAANQGVTGLAVRPSLTDPERLRGLVEAWGSGPDPTVRTLALRLDGRLLERAEIEVPADGGVTHAFALDDPGPATLEAVLEPAPADALPFDDRLALDPSRALARAAVAVAVEGDCDPALTTALAAHPGLRAATAAPELLVRCAASAPRGDAPALWVVRGPVEAPPAEPPAWDVEPGARAPRLAPEWLRPVQPPAAVEGRVLLGAGARPLIVEQKDHRRIVVMLDAGGLRDRPELPALLGLLLDRLARRELLMPVVRIGRDRLEVRVTPGPLPGARPAEAAPEGRLDLSPWLVVVALGLALHDLRRRARAAFAT
jgi:hypothetical protein